ncbi:hypothetical protein O0L34_g14468 [Tuta absoluta]|nr:hypothetical protein O0L34_g14468 [Tuta absoluta]
MVGVRETMDSTVLTEARLEAILEKALGKSWKAEEVSIRPAAIGLTGFLGDHYRATIMAKDVVTGRLETLRVFVKCLPMVNIEKAEFIDSNNFNRREKIMFQLFEELGGDEGPNAWRPKAYLYDDTILVMPDLSADGFAPRHFQDTLSLSDVLLVTASIARFHAAYANYETKKTVDPLRPYNFLDEYGDIMTEPTFCESLWLRAAAKLSANMINTFSAKYQGTISDLESKLHELYLESCGSLRYYSDTFNAIVHKDLWMNNILFAPGRAVIVDYQCVRYGPPTFDLMMLLYLCTTREFRDKHEKEVFHHYYSVFIKSLDAPTTRRLKEIGYDEEEFLRWCERARMLSLFCAIGIFPYVLMDPESAARTFDDPETFKKLTDEDRSEPVIQYARTCQTYLDRQVQTTEEFIERYLLKKVE